MLFYKDKCILSYINCAALVYGEFFNLKYLYETAAFCLHAQKISAEISVLISSDIQRSVTLKDTRFDGIGSFESQIWSSSPTMHGIEQK